MTFITVLYSNSYYCLRNILLLKFTLLGITIIIVLAHQSYMGARGSCRYLPPDVAFQIHLLSKMNDHRGNDMNMFNEVVQCVKAHALHYRVDFTTLQILSRKQLV